MAAPLGLTADAIGTETGLRGPSQAPCFLRPDNEPPDHLRERAQAVPTMEVVCVVADIRRHAPGNPCSARKPFADP